MAQLIKNIYGHQTQLNKLLTAKKNNRLAHALIFSGPEGIGKTLSAYALAQSLLCEKAHPACGKCPTCLQVEERKSFHILFIEPEGMYIKVESIRKILDFLSLQSLAPARVIIMKSAHKMNPASANSLLKILEEPPPKVYFILTTPLVSALPLTVHSRVQVARFLPLQTTDLQKILKQQASLEETKDDPTWLAQAGQGSITNVEKWKEHKDLRDKALEFLKRAVLQKELYPFQELSDIVKERKKALFVCLCYQQILRDACITRFSHKAVIHKDQKKFLDFLSRVPFPVLNKFFQKTVLLEQELKGNLDSPLGFDQFFMEVRENMKETCVSV